MIDKAKVLEILEEMRDVMAESAPIAVWDAFEAVYAKIYALPEGVKNVYHEGDNVPDGIYVLFAKGFIPELLEVSSDEPHSWADFWGVFTEGCNPRLVHVDDPEGGEGE